LLKVELNTINKPKPAISNIFILDFLIYLFLPLMTMTNLFDINCIKKITLKENVQKYTGWSNYNLSSHLEM